MADKRIDIDIKTSADTKGAQQAAKDIRAVGTDVDGLAEKLDRIKAINNQAGLLGGEGDYEGAAKLREEANRLSEEYARLQEAASGAGEAIAQSGEQAAGGINLMAQSQDDVRQSSDDAAISIENATVAVEELNQVSGEGSVKVLANDLEQASVSSEKFSGNIEKVVERSNTKLGRSVRQFNNIKRSLDGLVGSSSKAVTALKSLGKGFGIASLATAFFKGLGFVQTGFEKLDAPVQRFNENLRITESGFQRVVGPIAAVTGGLRQFVTESNNWINPFKKWSDYKEAVDSAAESIRRSETALDDYIAKATKELAERQKSVLVANQRAVAEANIARSLNEQADARERSEDAVTDAQKAASDNEKRLKQLAQNAKKIAQAEADKRKAEIEASDFPEARKIELKLQVDDELERYATQIGNTISESSIQGIEGVIAKLDEKIQELNRQAQPAKSQLERVAKPDEFAKLLTEKDQAVSRAQSLNLSREIIRKNLASPQQPAARRDLEKQLAEVTKQIIETSKARIPLQNEFNAKLGESIRVLTDEGFLKIGEEVTAETYKAGYEAAGKNAKELASSLAETKVEVDDLRENLRQAKRALDVDKQEQKTKETTKQLDRNTKEQNDAIKRQSEASQKATSDFSSALQKIADAGRGEIARPATSLGQDAFKLSPRARKAAAELQATRDAFVSQTQIEAFEAVAETLENDNIIDPTEASELGGLLNNLKLTIDPANTQAIEAVNDLITIAEKLSDNYDLIDSRIRKLEAREQEIKEGSQQPQGSIEGRSIFEPQESLKDIRGIVPESLPKGVKKANRDANRELAKVAGVITTGGKEEVGKLQEITGSLSDFSKASSNESEEILRILSELISSARSNGTDVSSLSSGGGGSSSSGRSSSSGKGTTTGAYSDAYTESVRSFGNPITAQSMANTMGVVVAAQNQVVAKVNALAKQVRTVS